MLKNLALLVTIITIVSCAKVGRPTGGKKDELPPNVLSSKPVNKSVDFNSKKIRIEFDEFIKLKDLNKQLIISPPMKNQPIIKPQGIASKYLDIKILDTLNENTTYTFNFGNAVIDNAEGNVLKQFKYLFSTGSYIDSLEVKGTVKDAILPKPETAILVMLYKIDEKFNDSIIFKKKPDYISNTLDSTYFNITNIKEGKYSLIAIKDKSNNLIYNPKEDKIGFVKDYIMLPSDSSFQIEMFKEKTEFNVKNAVEVNKNHIIVGFEGEWKNNIKEIYDHNNLKINAHIIKDRVKDSLHIWFKDEITDSLKIKIEKRNKPSFMNVKLRKKERDSLKISTNTSPTLHFRDTVSVMTNTPFQKLNIKNISLKVNDSIPVLFEVIESNFKDYFNIEFEKKPNTTYTLSLLPNSIVDYFGNTNDSIKRSFSTRKKEDYGEFVLKINNKIKSPIIIELCDEKLNVIQSDYLIENKDIIYKDLIPQKYIVRATVDENKNMKWDTGSYLEKKLPEKIIYFSKTVVLRANWTINEIFLIE